MLETEIKLLREAIEANTAALLGQQPSTPEAVEVTEDKPKATTKAKPKATKKEVVKEEPKDEETSSDEKITSQTVKDLAKTKMSDGVPRTTIKAIITKLGAESIADLDDAGLTSLHEKLTEL